MSLPNLSVCVSQYIVKKMYIISLSWKNKSQCVQLGQKVGNSVSDTSIYLIKYEMFSHLLKFNIKYAKVHIVLQDTYKMKVGWGEKSIDKRK